MNHRSIWLAGSAAVLVTAGSSRLWAVSGYTITNLSPDVPAVAFRIDDGGTAVGWTIGIDSTAHAVIWQQGQMRDLNPPWASDSCARRSNPAGQVVGWSRDTQGQPRGFLWHPAGGFRDLSTDELRVTTIDAINSRGQVAGVARQTNSSGEATSLPFLWDPATGLHPLSPWGIGGSIDAINDAGQVIGTYAMESDGALFRHAVLWRDGQPTDLAPGTLMSEGSDLNNRGQAVGAYYVWNTPGVPFLWDPQSGLLDLPTLGVGGAATAINERGQILGYCSTPEGSLRPVLWEDGVVHDLNDLIGEDSGWVLEEADGINDQGQIVGLGTFNGEPRAFLLTPIPEPAGLALLVLPGLLLGRGRRQRRSVSIRRP